jgi:hypothetical protein
MKINKMLRQAAFVIISALAVAAMAAGLDNLLGNTGWHWIVYPLGAMGLGWFVLAGWCLWEGAKNGH